MLLTVIIPIFYLDSDRKRNLEFIYNRLISHYTEDEIEIVLGIQDTNVDDYYLEFDRARVKHCATPNNNRFNKSFIFNKCCEETIKGQFLVFLDVDVYLPFHKLRNQLSSEHEVIKPFHECIFLDEDTTEKFLSTKMATASKDLKRISATGACCIIINSNLLSQVHMDENFTGWGWEDIDLANQLSSKFHITILDQQAVHLYHKPSAINYSNYSYYKQKYQYKHISYNKANKNDIGIILSYFSPCNFKQPRQNLLTMIDSLESTGSSVTLVEAVMPDAEPLVLPRWVNHYQINVNIKSTLFLKENLYNIGITKTQDSKILFLDTDILFDDKNWIDKSSRLLDTYDIIQPYDISIWLDKNFIPVLDYNFKQSFAKGIFHRKKINATTYHPGFAWGITRDFLDYIGGFYDKHAVGGSDLAFGYGICPDTPSKNTIRHWMNTNQLFVHTNAYQLYKQKIDKYKPKVGYLADCTCRHLYHGTHEKRNYINRNKEYLPPLINNDYPLQYNENGILEWINEKDAIKCLEYFQNRHEDD